MPFRASLLATERCLAGDDPRDEVPLASRERYRGFILVRAARVPEEIDRATSFKTIAARFVNRVALNPQILAAD
jgi:hypothetical protein